MLSLSDNQPIGGDVRLRPTDLLNNLRVPATSLSVTISRNLTKPLFCHGSFQCETRCSRDRVHVDRLDQCVFQLLLTNYYLTHANDTLVTPFDVVKTRLQTQPPKTRPLFVRPPQNTCCQPSHVPCVRNMSSMAIPRLSSSEIICVWDHGVWRHERVNGFYDAIKHVVRAEGVRGLWKGAGTSL